jgi:hypothetical protein
LTYDVLLRTLEDLTPFLIDQGDTLVRVNRDEQDTGNVEIRLGPVTLLSKRLLCVAEALCPALELGSGLLEFGNPRAERVQLLNRGTRGSVLIGHRD